MQMKTFRGLAAALCCAAGLTVSVSAAAPSAVGSGATARPVAEARFQFENPGTQITRTGSAITTISHDSFSFGATPEESATAFLANNVGLFGVGLADLTPGSLAGDGARSHQVMPVDGPDGQIAGYKFTLLSYLQSEDGIPVYRSDIRLLVRNEPGAPLVLVRSALRDLGDFVVPAAPRANVQGAIDDASLRFLGAHNLTPPQVVIYAGDPEHPVAPILAVVFELDVGQTGDANYARWRVVADAATGKAIATENLIKNVDVSGNISAQVTQGFKSAECNPEALAALPFARATIGATVVYADANGNFTVPNPGTAAVTVTGSLQGRYFNVFNPSALAPTVAGSFTPPGPANIVFNSANTDELRRAEANAYYFANTSRTFVLTANPSYPTISAQTNFRVNTAVSGTCNAFYDGNSINFYSAGGGCANTAFSDVVAHEYGHHVVNVAGSGQGQYGEGTGDCMGVIINDQPVLGFGFQNNCAAGIRTAANTLQYPQTGAIHAAGQLMSGCVWSLRNELVVTEPSNYRTILGRLMINAVQLHTGTEITPQIYTDYLTLDDNDGNLGNGTPHFCEINRAFASHSMATLSTIGFTFPSGQPTIVSPAGVASSVKVSGLCASVTPGTARVFIDKENDGTYVQSSMTDTGAGVYTFSFPPSTCGSTIRYYFSIGTSGGTVVNPAGAPTSYYTTVSGYGLTTVPSGQPTIVSPAGVASSVKVSGLCASVTPGTARVFIDKENDGTYVQSSMTDTGAGVYTFSFPPSTCGSTIRYYFSIGTSGGTVVNPAGAPTSYYTTVSGYGLTTVFSDSFQTNQGWAVTNAAATTSGFWERAIPSVANTFGAAPTVDADGSGQCYITQNAAGASIGEFDIDGGTVTLTSPAMNASGGSAFISYSRWFSNNLGAGPDDDTFTVQVSGNNGTTWQNLEVIGPNGGAQQNGGWYPKSFSVPAAVATAQFRIRFVTGETGAAGSIVEAAVDAVKLQVLDCNAPSCPADFDGNGFVTGEDFDAYVAAFEAGVLSADFDGDGFVTGEDFDAYVVAFEAGC